MIKDFKFHSPAPVYFGHETVKNNAELIASYGKRCYITTTRFPAGCENAALNDFISVCKDKGIEYMVNEDVVENPTVESCVEMAREAREFGAEFFPASAAACPAWKPRTCFLRGHDVELYEASGALGGHLIEAGSHPFKDGIAALNRWYQNELNILGVPVHLNSPMDAEKIKALRPDAVILAVGSTHFMPKIPGIDHRKTAGCYDVLMKNVKPGRKVVVVGGGMTGCELAYDLAAYEHCDVTLVEALDKVMSSGPVVPHAVHDMLLDLLDHFNVKVMTGHAIAAVNDAGAVIKSMADGSEQTLEADTVVMAIGLRPRADMTSELAGSGIQVFTTGDGLQVGNIRTCVSGAYEIARNI